MNSKGQIFRNGRWEQMTQADWQRERAKLLYKR